MTTVVAILVASPLVGAFSWSRVARELSESGIPVIVATPRDSGRTPPWWRQHAASVADAIRASPPSAPPVLIAHRGAGPLLPAIATMTERPVAGYVFVDAGIPRHLESRIDAMRREDPVFAEELLSDLRSGGRFPAWTMHALNPSCRTRTIDAVWSRGCAPFFTEPIPTSTDWPDAPCAYIRLSDAYRVPAEQAERSGWPVRTLDGGHFHILVDPVGSAQALRDVMAELDAASA